MLARNEVPRSQVAAFLRRRHRGSRKYHNIPTGVDGWTFQSKKEAEYFRFLKTLKAGGIVKLFLRQVPFHLPGHTIYRLDFLVFLQDGGILWVDVKGVRTKEYKLKRRQVEELYGISITEI